MHRKSVGFKTITITCLALALISTISLNIIRTYSINNTRTNALGSSSATTSQGSAATLANDPITIALDIAPITTSTSSSCDPSNPKTICLNPGDGGIAVGGHNITINTNSPSGWYMTATANSNDGTTNLVNTNDNSKVIPTLPNTVTIKNATKLTDNTWGVALPYGDWLASGYYNDETDYLSNDQPTLANTVWTSMDYINSLLDDERGIASQQATGPATRHIYYGVRVDNPDKLLAGDYQIKVTYTATAILPPAPELNTITPSTLYLTSGHDGTVKIKGSNTPTPLSNITNIYLDLNGNGTMDNYEECRDLTIDTEDTSNSTLICTMPTDTYLQYLGETTILSNLTTTNNGNGAGIYPIRLIHTGGDTATNLTYTYRNPSGQVPTTSSTNLPTDTNGTTNRTMSICRNGDPNSDCQVDIDSNMYPIAYVGTHSNAQWIPLDKGTIESSAYQGLWYNYSVGETATQGGGAKWANAITVSSSGRPYNVVPWDETGHDPYLYKIVRDEENGVYRLSEVLQLFYEHGTIPDEQGRTYSWEAGPIPEKNILGYYTYIPRYAYEVQRPNAVDRVVSPQNFNIHFETATDPKKTPAESCNLAINTDSDNNPMWGEQPSGNNSTNADNAGPDSTNVLAKDYRTTCVNESGGAISRLYTDANTAGNNTTWATHPAFSWLDNDGNGTELNGLWIGKYETTGSAINPTILPNQKHIGDMYSPALGNIGGYYTIAKHIGVYDPNNTGGNDVTVTIDNTEHTLPTNDQWSSKHNLSSSTSHMLKNSEWGAIAYLATSDYGAGINRVFNNAQYQSGTDGNNQSSRGMTGCGPYNSSGSTSYYRNGGAIGTNTACRSTNIEYSYNGTIGQLASTTNNPYGIYDLAGGAYEYVMGNYSSNPNETYRDSYLGYTTKPPYVDIYLSTDFSSSNKPAWATSTSTYYYYNDICAWGNCGGDALHETEQYQSVSGDTQSWGDDNSGFVYSSYRWFQRGSNAGGGSGAGLFNSSYINGDTYYNCGFRSVLLSAP